MDTALMAPLAPARTAMPVGVLLLLLQGIAEVFSGLITNWARANYRHGDAAYCHFI